MRGSVLRRDVLKSALGAAALTSVPVRGSAGESGDREFTPERHGFGFPNWSSQRQPFEPVERRIGRLPLAVGAASGGAALGAGVHYLWRRHRDDGGDEERG